MKKFSIYFFTAIFFITLSPRDCEWPPYPGKDLKVSKDIQQQQVINTPINEIEIA